VGSAVGMGVGLWVVGGVLGWCGDGDGDGDGEERNKAMAAMLYLYVCFYSM
jgi:hypothetical protein